jgi:hypothetical protein
MINAEFHASAFEASSSEVHYVPVPQTPSDVEVDCSVTLNFPEMVMLAPLPDLESVLNTDRSPVYSDSPAKSDVVVPVDDWALLPPKLQPPAFRVHRCHHRGVERCNKQDEFQLPLGFPEVIQHIHDLPHSVR